MNEVGCVALTLAKPEFSDAVEGFLKDLIEPVHKEAGVIQYEMHRDISNPCRFVFIERWQSREHFEAHVRAPHILRYLELTKGMLDRAEFYALDRVAG